jgi:hypothetical protein
MTITQRAFVLTCLGLTCGACATRIIATRPLDPAAAARLQDELSDETVAVHLKEARSSEIQLTRVKIEPEVLQGIGRDGPRALPLDDVRSVTWRSHAKGFRAALAGVLIGPIVGGLIGAAVPTPAEQDTIIHPIQGALVGLWLGPLVFGVFGAVMGVENRIDF